MQMDLAGHSGTIVHEDWTCAALHALERPPRGGGRWRGAGPNGDPIVTAIQDGRRRARGGFCIFFVFSFSRFLRIVPRFP
jgi:hypothetical protein